MVLCFSATVPKPTTDERNRNHFIKQRSFILGQISPKTTTAIPVSYTNLKGWILHHKEATSKKDED